MGMKIETNIKFFAIIATIVLCILVIPVSSNLPRGLESKYCSELNPNQCDYFLGLSRSQEKSKYSIGDRVTVMIKLHYTNVTSVFPGNFSNLPEVVESAMFFPVVDEYSMLIVNGSFEKLETFANIEVSFELIHANSRWIIPRRKWYQSGKYIPFRTAIVTLNEGSPIKIEWENTKCYFEACGCLDNLCPVTCDNPRNCNVQIHLGWAGNDDKKQGLTSALKSVYKLRNVL